MYRRRDRPWDGGGRVASCMWGGKGSPENNLLVAPLCSLLPIVLGSQPLKETISWSTKSVLAHGFREFQYIMAGRWGEQQDSQRPECVAKAVLALQTYNDCDRSQNLIPSSKASPYCPTSASGPCLLKCSRTFQNGTTNWYPCIPTHACGETVHIQTITLTLSLQNPEL